MRLTRGTPDGQASGGGRCRQAHTPACWPRHPLEIKRALVVRNAERWERTAVTLLHRVFPNGAPGRKE